jgi:hypothetical protein
MASENVASLTKKLKELTARVVALESPLKPSGVSINKFETHHNDEGLNMGHDDMIQSMVNAIKIINPKLIVDGRHLIENVKAITGCKVLTEKMMDEAYALLKKG